MFYSFLLLDWIDFLWFTFRFQQGPRSVPWEKSPRYEFDRHQQGGATAGPARWFVDSKKIPIGWCRKLGVRRLDFLRHEFLIWSSDVLEVCYSEPFEPPKARASHCRSLRPAEFWDAADLIHPLSFWCLLQSHFHSYCNDNLGCWFTLLVSIYWHSYIYLYFWHNSRIILTWNSPIKSASPSPSQAARLFWQMLSAVIHLHGHRAPASTLPKVEEWDRVFSCFLHFHGWNCRYEWRYELGYEWGKGSIFGVFLSLLISHYTVAAP